MRNDERAEPGPGDAGFTLLEMLVVVLVLSLMAGLIVSRGPSRSATLDSRAAADSLAQALRGARVTAIAGGEPVHVEVDLARQSVYGGGVPAPQIPPAMRLTYITEAGRPVAAGHAAITFASDGSSSGGALELSSQSVRSLVTVDPFTGRVQVSHGG